jgi:predicted peptidase
VHVPGTDLRFDPSSDTLNALVDEVIRNYRVDKSRVYLTGLSMGGFGTWSLAAAHPEKFAAMVPIC